MNILGDVIFHWRSNESNLLVGVLVVGVLVIMGLIACRDPKSRLVPAILFGSWVLYAAFIFVSAKIWPDEVCIDTEGISGRHDLSRFAVKAADIRSIESSRMKGHVVLHLHLKNDNNGVGIPVIYDENQEMYKAALSRLCPDVHLEWNR